MVGEIQEPNVVLEKSSIDLGVIYVGVPVKNTVVFESLNFADSSFRVASVSYLIIIQTLFTQFFIIIGTRPVNR